jgi:23S rRNA (guanosine2251-2'-O)-methyltransferase
MEESQEERFEPDAGNEPERPQSDRPAPGPDDAQGGRPLAPEGGTGAPRPFGGGDFANRGRRRGRRGRGGGQRFGGPPQRGPGGPRPIGGPGAPAHTEEDSQSRELAAYERRQQQQRRSISPFRGPGWVAGQRPAAPSGGVFRPTPGGFRPGGGFRGGQGRPMGAGRGGRRPGGAQYTEQIRRATAGPRSGAAPSHEAGEPIAGPHAVLEAIRAGRVLKRLFISNERGTQTGPVQDLIQEAQGRRIFIRYVDAMEIQRVSPIESHQGVVAIVEGKPGVELDEFLLHLDGLSQPGLVLVIDSLQDPQNFGVLLRSSEGAGVDGVIIPKHRAVGLTPAVAKTSAGASEHLMIAEVANLRQAVDALKEKGIWVVATDESGDLLYDEVDYRGPTAIVIGGEAEGIRRLVLEGCDQVVRIPMEGHVASLNAASAGTVVLYEALRQRRRNVPPADTRTPRPERPAALMPQDEAFGEVAEGEMDETEIDPLDEQMERDDGEVLTPAESDGADDVNVDEPADDDAEADADEQTEDVGSSAETPELVDEAEAVADAPKKRAPRAKKPAATKRAPRKKPAE